jgi:hypothetical protein
VISVFALLLLVGDAPTPDRSPARIATEKCVWDQVQQKLGKGAPIGNIDAELAVGRDAADACAKQIRTWAEGSPAVLQSGEPVEQVEERMLIHYSARGALFAGARAKPFHLESNNAPNQ